ALTPPGLPGDLVLASVFGVLAVATYRSGIRAPALVSVAKGILIFLAVFAVVGLVLARLGGPGEIFAAARRNMATDGLPDPSLTLEPSTFASFASLVLGSAMALLVYPHVLTAAFAAKDPDVLRRSAVTLPAWTGLLGLFGLLGVAALATGVRTPRGQAEAAVPLLVQQLAPPVVTGVVFGALVVAALVPAAVMSVAVAMLFVRNVYVEYFHPTATPKHQVRVARGVSLVTKIGAFAFVLGLRDQDAIDLQLLGGVWILQTFPAVGIGLFSTWLHRGALLAGWAVGMAAGTCLVTSGEFSAVVNLHLFGASVPLYTALLALGLNLAVATALTPVLHRVGVARSSRTSQVDRLPRPDAPGWR
ncbi:SLC5/6 family protein, partial [Frankia casuarinae]|uniref:sodium:solute symporter n=2 Tax=Frankia TaxID=1854 RepID=UPI001F1D5C86